MTVDLYVWIGLAVGLATLPAMVWYANDQADDTADLVMMVILSVVTALTAGFMWPLTVLALVIVGPIVYARRRRESQQRHSRGTSRPETDREKYERMASEQEALAYTARQQGLGELADMQAGLAKQYREMARIYNQ